jgi:hypothetical protein
VQLSVTPLKKLSRRDASGKPVSGDPLSKRVLQSVIHLGGVAGTIWTGSPAGVLGGGLVQDLLNGDPRNPLQAKVSDTDMLILAKAVDGLQTQLMTHYYQYLHYKQQWLLTEEANRVLRASFDKALKLHTDHSPETLSTLAVGASSVAKKNRLLKPTPITPVLDNASFSTIQPLMESLVDTASRDVLVARQAYNNAREGLGLLVGPDVLVVLDEVVDGRH